jgi:hypothetical protein
VTEVAGPAELRVAADRLKTESAPRAAAERVIAAHSFDMRARRIVADALEALGVEPPFAVPPAAAKGQPIRVHLIVPYGGQGPQSSAYIRLLCPLTDETVADRVAVTLGAAEDPLPACDICIVQRAAMPSSQAVDRLVGELGAMGAALVVDVDDAFVAMDDHPEAEAYRPLNAAIEHAIAASAETWFSTPELARLYGHVAHRHVVMPNALDPRIWRDWRNSRPEPFVQDKVRMLYMGTGTHGPDFAAIRPALDRLWQEREGRFDVTLIGIAADIAPAPWLHRLAPPGEAIAYHRFVRWLRGQGPFDIGLAPLADTVFNSVKSDIKLLDYCALGLLPVVQDCPAYRRDRTAAQVALYASDWFETLLGLIDAPDGARAAAGQAWLWERRAVAAIATPMIARLEALL